MLWGMRAPYRMRVSGFLVACGLLAVGCAPGCASAQSGAASGKSPAEPATEGLLARLEAAYVEYLRSVPSLFCDERVRSDFGAVASTHKVAESQTESVFRLQRVVEGEPQQTTLVESRDIRRVDGKAVRGGSFAGPVVLKGVFGTALALLSPREEGCIRYTLHPGLGRFGAARGRIVMDFETLRAAEQRAGCSVRPSNGRAMIDPATMHIARLEVKTPDFEIKPGVLTEWRWTADYAPVVLSGSPFWLPKTIESDAVSQSQPAVIWSFRAVYSNYHKLTVSSRILTGAPDAGEAPEPGGASHPRTE